MPKRKSHYEVSDNRRWPARLLRVHRCAVAARVGNIAIAALIRYDGRLNAVAEIGRGEKVDVAARGATIKQEVAPAFAVEDVVSLPAEPSTEGRRVYDQSPGG